MGRAEGHAVGWRAARRVSDAPQLRANCERRDEQQDGSNARGRVAREERAATRSVGGEATLRALAFAGHFVDYAESSARSVASAAARFAGRGPFLTLRRCEGERASGDELNLQHGSCSHELRLIAP